MFERPKELLSVLIDGDFGERVYNKKNIYHKALTWNWEHDINNDNFLCLPKIKATKATSN